MASKSKKRRRVLGASCILAALIIAGSSFAWFTSKDEVTNRLTANSDYGVSIVESFVPPKNMLPGEEVNKDVYAVNTGSIDAFVKETVSAKLTYTYEQLVTNFDADECVELKPQTAESIDGVVTNEAGGFLAWTNAEVGGERYATGPVNSARMAAEGREGKKWTPPAEGDYIFRRAIETTTDDSTTPPTTTTKYTYAGYHYVPANGTDPAKYYKIVIGNDNYPTVDFTTNKQVYDIYVEQAALGLPAGSVDEKTGEITADPGPAIQYVVEKKVENQEVDLTYHKQTTSGDVTTPAYLDAIYISDEGQKARVDDAKANKTAAEAAERQALLDKLAAETDLAQKEVTYRNAIGEYNSAVSRYNQTNEDYQYALKLAKATNELHRAAKARAEAEQNYQNAEQALKDAADAIATEAGKINAHTDTGYDTFGNVLDLVTGTGTPATYSANNDNNIAFSKLVPQAVQDLINNNGPHDAQSNLSKAKTNMGNMSTKWNEIVADAKAVREALDTLASITGDDAVDKTAPSTSTAADAARDKLEENLAELIRDLEEYQTLYAGFIVNVSGAVAGNELTESALTNLVNDAQTTNNGYIDTVEAAASALNTKVMGDGGIDELVDDFVDKYDTFHDETNEDGDKKKYAAAKTAWQDAVTKYNNTVYKAADPKGAYQDYSTEISKVQAQPNDFAEVNTTSGHESDGKLTDNSATLVGSYGAGTATTTGSVGQVTYSEDLYKNYWDYNTATDTVEQIEADKREHTTETFTQLVANYSDSETPPEGSPAQTVKALADKVTAMNGAKNTAEQNYNAATQALTDAGTAYTNAQTATGNADTALSQAQAAATSQVKFRINLAEDLAWTPELADGETAKEQAFYLNKILTAGETSAKLIDSVVMDENMSAKDYKDLTFDLNVGMDSIQVAYDDNQRGYTTATVNSAENFKMDATLANALQEGTAVSWATRAAADPAPTPAPTALSYSVTSGTGEGATTTVVEPVAITPFTVGEAPDAVTYKYKFTLGDKTYVGTSLADGTVYKEANAAATALDGDGTATLTVA